MCANMCVINKLDVNYVYNLERINAASIMRVFEQCFVGISAGVNLEFFG